MIELRRKIIGIFVVFLMLAMLATPLVGMACAKPSTTVSGTIAVTGALPLEEKTSGKSDNTILKIELSEEWMGDIAGLSDAFVATWIIKNWVPPMGGPETWLNIHEKITFPEATVLDQSGSLTLEINIEKGNGHWVVLTGTGELEDLQGQGTLSLQTQPYSYSGQVHFSP